MAFTSTSCIVGPVGACLAWDPCIAFFGCSSDSIPAEPRDFTLIKPTLRVLSHSS